MTDKLDEIFDNYGMIGSVWSTNPDDNRDVPYLKQQILQWVSDEVIGKSPDNPYGAKDAFMHQWGYQASEYDKFIRDNMRNILKQHGFKEGGEQHE